MIIYDDLEPSEKIKVYDKGVSFTDDPAKIQEMRVGYRTGDMWAPKLDGTEALARRRRALRRLHRATARCRKTDGQLGLRVVEIIEACHQSMRRKVRRNGETVNIESRGK